MTISTGIWDAKTRLSEFVNHVVFGGQRVLITRNGKAVAALVSPHDLARLEALETEDGAAARRSAMEKALTEARFWSSRLLENSGGKPFPPLDGILREAREEGLE